MSTINERLKEISKIYFNENVSEFARATDIPQPTLNNIISNRLSKPSANNLEKIVSSIETISPRWLLTGEGKMLKSEPVEIQQSKNLIPFYDDVVSIGGTNEVSANMGGIQSPAEYIDAGDWFKDATAALRHYGDSMTEYPPGCILALKEVQDRRLIVPGRDYVIETDEYRITKQVQLGTDVSYIIAYSTNDETYADGQLIHAPFPIPWDVINRIFLVLGYVVKKNGGTIVFSNQKK